MIKYWINQDDLNVFSLILCFTGTVLTCAFERNDIISLIHSFISFSNSIPLFLDVKIYALPNLYPK